VFFVFEVQSTERARAFINAPEATQAGKHRLRDDYANQ